LSVSSTQLDFFIPDSQDLVFQVTLSFDEFSLSLGVLTLLLLVAFNPHIPCLLFSLNNFIEVADFLSQLLFGQFELLLNSLSLNVFVVELPLFLDVLLV